MAINTNIDISADITSNFILGIFVAVLAIVGAAIYFMSKNDTEKWHWKHLISDPQGKGSLTRTLQLIGGLTGTFVVIYHTLKLQLSTELFVIYMAALGVSEGFTKWVNVKYPQKETKDE